MAPEHGKDIDAFLCHSVKDKTVVDAVCGSLEGHGIRCWIASRDILAGENWARSIMHAIGRSRMLLLVLSSHSNESIQVLREVERAVHGKIPILVFWIEDIKLSGDLEYFLSGCDFEHVKRGRIRYAIKRLPKRVRSSLAQAVGTDPRVGRTAQPKAKRARLAFLAVAAVALAGAVLAAPVLLLLRTSRDEPSATDTYETYYQSRMSSPEPVAESPSNLKVDAGTDPEVNISSSEDGRFQWIERKTEATLKTPNSEIQFRFKPAGEFPLQDSPDLFGFSKSFWGFGKSFGADGYWYSIMPIDEEARRGLPDPHRGYDRYSPIFGHKKEYFDSVIAGLAEVGLTGFGCLGLEPHRMKQRTYYEIWHLVREKNAEVRQQAPSSGQGDTGRGVSDKASDTYRVKFDCSMGSFVVECNRAWSPNGADRFYTLVKNGFFTDAKFFRVVPNFIVQFGLPAEPEPHGAWVASRIPDDPKNISNTEGTLVFAKPPNITNARSTQLFINLNDNSASLDAQSFTPFGRVVEGMDIVQRINAEYGEEPDQDAVRAQGNAYLDESFPRLDGIVSAMIIE